MDALNELLTCPVCMDLFHPPVLLLSCSHNFCQQCLELVLVGQNCTSNQGQFCCPLCRKVRAWTLLPPEAAEVFQVIYLKERGIKELQRNILAENILEKFKEEREILHTKEQNELAQMCEKHGEIMNLICLSEEEPICGTCKLFGDHKLHQVAKISDTCAERKISLATDLQLLLQESDRAAQAIRDTEQLMWALSSNATDVQAMLDTIGDSLLSGISRRLAALRQQLEQELDSKLEKLQLVANEQRAPQHLYQQMKGLLQHPGNDVQFLQEHKRLKAEMERLVGNSVVPQVPPKDSISIRHYYQELIKGIDIRAFMLPDNDIMGTSPHSILEGWWDSSFVWMNKMKKRSATCTKSVSTWEQHGF
ncbi:tripartite motif-containing protein 54-like [Suncus etruscus]|uniref:tripartite motif-containing protein 54-like n=1 Tax=Suncus etruscus TaxID=109475 RepID=UPI00210FF441|nr:tripartite motif-containing protein 54-like [Suncus etruscus]